MLELLNLKSQIPLSVKLLKFVFLRGIMFERLSRGLDLTCKNIILFYFERAEPVIFQEFIIN